MEFRQTVVNLLSLAVIGLVAASTDAADKTSKTERLFFYGPESINQLNKLLVGQGIDGTDTAAVALTAIGDVVWRVTRDETDTLGTRHVFYRQWLQPASQLAGQLEERFKVDGVRFEGAEIGVHWRKGTAEAVFGHQQRRAPVNNLPTIGGTAAAFEAAQTMLAYWPGFAVSDAATWDIETRANLLGSATLFLRAEEKGLRFLWRLQTLDRDLHQFSVTMDAGTAEVLAVDRVFGPSDNCGETIPSGREVPAIGVPQNSQHVPQRSLFATESSFRPGFTHEAYSLGSPGQVPEIQILYGVDPDPPSPLLCGVGDYWTALAITSPGNTPTYVGQSGDPIPGSVGGDAGYMTG